MVSDLDKTREIAEQLKFEMRSIPEEEMLSHLYKRIKEIPEPYRGLVDNIVSASLIYGSRAEKSSMQNHRLEKTMVALGAILLAASLAIAIFIPEPSAFQYFVFRTTLALAGGCFVAFLPGMLKISLGNRLKATGALAVIVLIYMIAPAAL